MQSFPQSMRQRRVFVDTGAYFALLDRRDQFHADAVAILRSIAAARYRQFTTNIVVIEAHALILSNLGIRAAGQFIRDVRAGNTVIIRARASDEAAAEALLFGNADKDYSFTDSISFVVMERLGITQAFAFDHHFDQYGLTVLSPLPD